MCNIPNARVRSPVDQTDPFHWPDDKLSDQTLPSRSDRQSDHGAGKHIGQIQSYLGQIQSYTGKFQSYLIQIQ